MTVVHTDSLLGQTWHLKVGYRNGAYMVDPAGWDARTDLLVDNVEGLCRKVLNAANDRLPERLEAADYDDSLGYLLGRVIEIVPRYRPRDERSQLGAWLKQELHWDLLDNWERTHGRHGEKRVIDLRGGSGSRLAGFDDTDLGLDRPGGLTSGGAGEPDLVRAFPREWADLPADRGTPRPGPVGGLGLNTGGGREEGSDRAGADAGGPARAGAASADQGAWRDCLSCGWRSYPAAPNGMPGWHYPDACLACGHPLTTVAA